MINRMSSGVIFLYQTMPLVINTTPYLREWHVLEDDRPRMWEMGANQDVDVDFERRFGYLGLPSNKTANQPGPLQLLRPMMLLKLA